MRKTLTLGTLVALTVPVATVVACGNGQEGDDKSSASTKASSGVYVQKHKDSEYPQMNQYWYDQLNDSAPNDFAYQFYNLKGKSYFQENWTRLAKNFQGNWDGNFIFFDWSTSSKDLRIIMNWHELWDYANSKASQAFPYK